MIALLAFLAVLILPGLAQARARGRFVELTIVTCNDAFTSKGTNLPDLIARGVDLIFVQEGRAAVYRNIRNKAGGRVLPLHMYGVHQDPNSLDKAGSAVIWKHTAFNRSAAGYTFAVHAPGLMARWIAWLRGTIGGRKAWLWSAHRPPIRDRRWWRPFDLAFKARLRLALRAHRLILGGMDSNQRGGPHYGIRGVRWHAVGDSIDGFLLSASIEVLSIEELPMDTSDHHPVIARVRVPV